MTPLLVLLLTIMGLVQACNLERNVDYPENDIEKIQVSGEGECATKCFENLECDYWSFHAGGTDCWLKRRKGNVEEGRTDRVSGDKACGSDCSQSPDIEHGIDYPENDIEEFIEFPADQITCEEECTKNEKCKYWSYSPRHNRCWLKTDKKRVDTHKDRVSGKKKCGAACVVEEKIDYPKGDIDGKQRLDAKDDDTCSKMCFDEPRCNYWSYSPKFEICWLKYTKGKNGFIQGHSDRISGNKACGNQGPFYRTGNGKLCTELNYVNIKTLDMCKKAATFFGLEFDKPWEGPGDHPGCLFADDKREKVFFNTVDVKDAATTATSNYDSLCEKE